MNQSSNKSIFVTGAAGFIGHSLVKALLKAGYTVVGIDNINDYYDINLKYARLKDLGIERKKASLYNNPVNSENDTGFCFVRLDLEDAANLAALFAKYNFMSICHLGAQAGVRYSIKNPAAYVSSNVVGFTNILEECRKHKVEHLVYASSSSVYGLNARMPFSTHDAVDHPVSFYAATKRANELMAHVYSHLYKLPTTGLRFFTVYGPWGRPDMSPMLFADAIMHGQPLKVFNHGDMGRDFTYIDDIIEGVMRVLVKPPHSSDATTTDLDPSFSNCPFKIYNIGSSSPVRLGDYIAALEKALGKPAIKEYLPMQPGDVKNTYCDISDLERDFGYRPQTTLEQGLKAFAEWYHWWEDQKVE
jgi:UDP-glucuronate 4-epimerase